MTMSADLQAFADDALISARDHVADQIQALRQLHNHLTEALHGAGTLPANVDQLIASDHLIASLITKANVLADAATTARQAGQ